MSDGLNEPHAPDGGEVKRRLSRGVEPRTPPPGELESPMPGRWQLPELVSAADAQAPWVDRNVWLVHMLRWLTRDAPAVNAQGTPFAVLRLRHLLGLLDRQPRLREQVSGILGRLWREADAAALFADTGLACDQGLMASLWSRWRSRWLPVSPDTRNLAVLFTLMLPPGRDTQWLDALDEGTLQRVAALFEPATTQGSAKQETPWWAPPVQAMHWLAAAVQASALAPELRSCLQPPHASTRPFEMLSPTLADWVGALHAEPAQQRAQRANLLRGVLQACHTAADGAREHMREHGLAAAPLFALQQLHARLDRMEALLDALVSDQPALPMRALLSDLATAQRRQRSVLGVLREHYQLLARKVAERHALSGEHYVARDRREYRALLRQAAGGGAVVAGTTVAKFGLAALGLAPLWLGLAAGSVYAASFVLIFLLHWTLATKQPSLTAATLAARLAEMQASHTRGEHGATDAVVDEIAALLRSQMAGVIGNLGLVIPGVALLQGLSWWLAGAPLIDQASAHHVLHSLSVLGPAPFYAAFTGVLLFASSLIGGWFENAFAYHRLQGAIATNPDVVARLGTARAQRWAGWWQRNINGLSSNIALGLMLGLAPVLATFAGLPLDVRHVTLSTGQLTAAVGTLGWSTLGTASFWGCVVGIAVIGLLNLGVSFALALHVAMKARGATVGDQRALRHAVARRLLTRPWSFLVQPPDAKPDAQR